MTTNFLNLAEILTLDVPANLFRLLPFQVLQRGGAVPQPFAGTVRDRPVFGQIWPRGEWQPDVTIGANLPQPPALASTVTVTPAEGSVDIASGTPTLQLTAVVRDANGNVLVVTPEWVSSDPSKATVSSSGLVTGVAVGDVTISAVAQGKVGQATVHVFASPPGVNSVTVTPSPWAVGPAGATLQFTAVVRDASGNILSGRTITWDTSNHAIATINSAGLLTAVAAGTVDVTGATGGKTGTASGTVLVAPDVTDPLLYFPCDETLTTITSSGRLKETWTAFAVDTNISGKRGNARRMKNVFVNAPDVGFIGNPEVVLGGATSWSVALWFNPGQGFWSVVHSPTSVGGWGSVLLTTDRLSGVPGSLTLNMGFTDFGIQLDGSRPRPFVVSFSTGPSSLAGYFPGIEFAVLSSVWHHLVIVNDQTSAKFRVYLDGALIYTDNVLNVAAIGDGKIRWTELAAEAATLSGGTSSAWGSMDEVYIFDRALTGTEVGVLAAI